MAMMTLLFCLGIRVMLLLYLDGAARTAAIWTGVIRTVNRGGVKHNRTSFFIAIINTPIIKHSITDMKPCNIKQNNYVTFQYMATYLHRA